jgi:excisionase family DNA binding protein
VASTTEHDLSDLISVNEAAEIVGVTHFTIRRRIADGSLPGYRFGPRTLRVRRSDVLAMLRPLATVGAL